MLAQRKLVLILLTPEAAGAPAISGLVYSAVHTPATTTITALSGIRG